VGFPIPLPPKKTYESIMKKPSKKDQTKHLKINYQTATQANIANHTTKAKKQCKKHTSKDHQRRPAKPRTAYQAHTQHTNN
jgi:hypothetical protein